MGITSEWGDDFFYRDTEKACGEIMHCLIQQRQSLVWEYHTEPLILVLGKSKILVTLW